jgi:tRNA modification GTPase
MLTLRGARWLLAQVGRLRDAARTLPGLPSLNEAQQACRQIAARLEIVSWFTRPLRIVIAGPPNAGKSTLANALADRPVSVVSPTPGTTRDWVEAGGEAAGFPVTWLDTAGLRDPADAIEAASIERTRQLMAGADAVLLILDATEAARPAQPAFLATHGDLRPACVALNKTDLASPADVVALRGLLPPAWRSQAIAISATLRTGLDALLDALLAGVGRLGPALEGPAAFTNRQVEALEAAAASVDSKSFRDNVLRLVTAPEPP